MNKFLMAMSILGLAVNAHANCPKKLAGKYVSSVEYTIMSKVSQPPNYENSVADVRYDITSAEIKNGTLTFVKVFRAPRLSPIFSGGNFSKRAFQPISGHF